MSPTNGDHKAVRFAAGTSSSSSAKRSYESDDDNDAAVPEPKRHKRPQFSDDSGDDEQAGGSNEEQERDGVVPSEHELLEAKRERRLKRQAGGGDDDDDNGDNKVDTHIDHTTSLASEGIEIEPFHMQQEKTDGSGFFDGETYVFRKHNPDDEPDAWLDSLGDAKQGTGRTVVFQPPAQDESSKDNDFDNLTPQELYTRILPLVSDTETVMQALVRYGNLLKRKPLQRGNVKSKQAAVDKGAATVPSDEAATEAKEMAQTALNDLTEAANALLLKGKVDIYQKTRNDILKLLPDEQDQQADDNGGDKPVVKWEYEGSEDKQIHGPYTTLQMQGWIQAGYFVGASAVKVRTVTDTVKVKSMQEDLLADLMDDDEDGDDTNKPSEMVQERGEWMVSDKVSFQHYA